MLRSLSIISLLAIGFGGDARASDGPPWREADDLPLPDGARSAVVVHGETPILAEPSVAGARRGTALLGVKLPVFGAKRGPGCAARWINVGPEAWICQDGLALDGAPPIDAVGTPAGSAPA